MADSTQGADERPVHKQGTRDTASQDTTTNSRGPSGNVTHALNRATADIHRDAAPTRGQAAHPNMAASDAAPSAHDANEVDHATENAVDPAYRQSTTLSSDQHIPPQSPQESEEGRLPRETTEQIARCFPADSARGEVWDSQLQEYRHPDQLAHIPAGQTAEAAQATRLPQIREQFPNIDSEAVRPATIPAGHMRPMPDHWVAEHDLSDGHREARQEALRFERDLHELGNMVYRLQCELRRHLYER
jgi:hypothetical protein